MPEGGRLQVLLNPECWMVSRMLDGYDDDENRAVCPSGDLIFLISESSCVYGLPLYFDGFLAEIRLVPPGPPEGTGPIRRIPNGLKPD